MNQIVPMDRAAFADAMNVAAPGILDRFEAYLAHLEKWQRAINLVGPKTLNDPWRRHILDSAQLFEYLPDQRPLKIADLGSGAGLPGLVLAIMTGADVHMVESDQRKATFIREAARLTETNVTVHARRIEDVPALNADVVTARALAPMDRLLPWVYRHLKNGGKSLLLKGADAEEELTLTAKRWTMKISRKRSLSDASGTVLILDDLAPVTDV